MFAETSWVVLPVLIAVCAFFFVVRTRQADRYWARKREQLGPEKARKQLLIRGLIAVGLVLLLALLAL